METRVMDKFVASATEDARQALLSVRLTFVAVALAIVVACVLAHRHGVLIFP
jgi:hypothetical protein